VLRQVAARGRTVVMTSHDLLRSAELATRVDILSHGVIAASYPQTALDSAALPALYREAIRG
jgi:ABC-type multidrug transport system ATPase subunit